jgi:hypothetical protein
MISETDEKIKNYEREIRLFYFKKLYNDTIYGYFINNDNQIEKLILV